MRGTHGAEICRPIFDANGVRAWCEGSLARSPTDILSTSVRARVAHGRWRADGSESKRERIAQVGAVGWERPTDVADGS